MSITKFILLLAVAGSIFSVQLMAQTSSGSASPASGVAAVSPTPEAENDRYRIGYQDMLNVTVYKHPELSGNVPVDPSGRIHLFQLDAPLVAICKTERQLADEIEAAYKVSYLRNPQVNVVADQKSQTISVMGAVEHPGIFPVARPYHLLEILALAGGPNKEAGTRLIVARTGSSAGCRSATDTPQDSDLAVMGFKLHDVQSGKSKLWMQPGDVVSVLKADVVYVYGNVIKPGELQVHEPITLRQAIASSEGLKPATNKNEIRIIRQKPDSLDREEIKVNLNDIEKGRAPDPYLEPNDIVAVSNDPLRDILYGLGTAIRNGIPTMVTRVPVP